MRQLRELWDRDVVLSYSEPKQQNWFFYLETDYDYPNFTYTRQDASEEELFRCIQEGKYAVFPLSALVKNRKAAKAYTAPEDFRKIGVLPVFMPVKFYREFKKRYEECV